MNERASVFLDRFGGKWSLEFTYQSTWISASRSFQVFESVTFWRQQQLLPPKNNSSIDQCVVGLIHSLIDNHEATHWRDTLAATLFRSNVTAKEQLIRRRDLSKLATAWEPDGVERSEETGWVRPDDYTPDEEHAVHGVGFVRGRDWGKYSKSSSSKSNKGSKGSKASKGNEGSKGPKGSKGNKGENRPPSSPSTKAPTTTRPPVYSPPSPMPDYSPKPPSHQGLKPTYAPHPPPSYGGPRPSHSPPPSFGQPKPFPPSKDPRPSYSTPPPPSHQGSRPPLRLPTAEPPKPEFCIPDSKADTCGTHTSCSASCVPKFCKLPVNPHKIHGPGYAPKQDRYVELGDVCGWLHYVEGTPRHDFEVCCETPDNIDDPYYASCTTCATCIFPQKVNAACCLEASPGYSDRMEHDESGRDGCPNPDRPVCCKCGPNNYSCIGPIDDCDASCAGPTLAPPPEPTDPPSPKPTACKVFVTSMTQNGILGGIAGANALCQTLIDGAPYTSPSSRTWKAWLSTTDDDGDTTYSKSTDWNKCSSYELLDGTPIASSWNDLTDGSIANPIRVDANGQLVPIFGDDAPFDTLWTGTRADGLPRSTNVDGGINCNNWSSASSVDRGRFGLISVADNADWTSYAGPDCSAERRVYCFEDAPSESAFITGTVRADAEGPLAGVTITLLRNGVIVATTTTNAQGFYELTGLDAGDYVVRETNPMAYPVNVRDYDTTDDGDDQDLVASTPDNEIPVTLTPGEVDDGNDFVDARATIPGMDASISGIVQDTSGNPLVGVTITLYPSDGVGGTPIAVTMTDDQGSYVFNNVDPGDYVVVETDPCRYVSVTDYDTSLDGDANEGDTTGDNEIAVTLISGEMDAGNDFVDTLGPPELGTISGTGRISLGIL